MKRGIIWAILGAIAGFAYYHFIGCRTGHCPLTSNPFITTGYGFLTGLIVGWKSEKSSENSDQKDS